MLQADSAHGLRDTRSFAINHSFCSLGGDVAWRKTRTAGSDNEVEMLLIAPFAQRGLDLFAFIRNDSTRADHSLRQLGDHRANVFAAGIGTGADCTAITDSKNPNRNHCLCLPDPLWGVIMQIYKLTRGENTSRRSRVGADSSSPPPQRSEAKRV